MKDDKKMYLNLAMDGCVEENQCKAIKNAVAVSNNVHNYDANYCFCETGYIVSLDGQSCIPY